jgi:urate oxidase
MPIKLTRNSYGKTDVKLTKVIREGKLHHLLQFEVAVLLTGDFSKSFTDGDNRKLVATDSIKNAVYVLAKENDFATAEAFAAITAAHFVNTYKQVKLATVNIEQVRWKRINVKGKPHDHAFLACGAERHTASAVIPKKGKPPIIHGGVVDLLVLKSTRSAFKGFVTDRYRTLKDTDDRIFSTSITAKWEYGPGVKDFAGVSEKVRNLMLETFATHMSYAVQQTMYEIGKVVLAGVPQIKDLDLVLPNKHHIPMNLDAFDLKFDNDIYVPTDAPYGDIRAYIERE